MSINTDTQLSKLNALNGMASYLGIPPLQSLSDIERSPDFQLAEVILDETVHEVCAHGMPCNTDYNYTLVRNVDNEIPLEAGMISAFPEDSNQKYIIERDAKLYDRENNTSIFDKDVDCTVFWLQEYESLPAVVRKYVYVSSARRLVSRVKGDDAVLATTQLDIVNAQTDFLTYTENIRSTNMIHDNYEAQYAVNNNTPNMGYYYY